MATMQIVYWRDIPAQIKGREGRKRSSLPLEERFEKAIDAAAMRGGADSTDDYLADFHTTHGGQLRRIAVQHAEAVGRLTGWRPAMPVTQWMWRKP